MADKEQVIKERVENSGIFDFSALYKFAHMWLKEENYGVVEEKYSEKISGNTRDISIEWVASKTMSDYFKIEHKIKFEISNLTDVEVEIDGKKQKMNKGKVWIEIKGNLLRDPGSNWDTTPFYRFIRDIYDKFIIPSRVENVQEKIMSDVRDYKDELKAFLELVGKR